MPNLTIPSVEIIKVIDQNRKELAAKIQKMYEAEGCGVCEKPGAEVFWFNPISRGAHVACYSAMESVEADLMAKIETVFANHHDRNMAHVRAVEAVKKKLKGVSIKTFLETEGAFKMKQIFDSVGLSAALNPSSRL